MTVQFKGAGAFLLGLLTIAFVVLKLTGVIAWSWWLVLLPLWGPAVLVITLAALATLVIYLIGKDR